VYSVRDWLDPYHCLAPMNLHLTGNSFLNSEYVTSSGKVVYKVSTPHTWNRSSTITRLIETELDASGSELHGQFAHLAQVDHRLLKRAAIRYKGQEIDTKRFFRKEGFGWYGRSVLFARDYCLSRGCVQT
jgi:hypothetical protein